MTHTIALVAALLASASHAQEKRPLPDLPWHLADVYIAYQGGVEVDSLSVDISILDDISHTDKMFVVPVSGSWVDSVGTMQPLYFGRGSRLSPGYKPIQTDENVFFRTSAFQFSRWGETDVANIRTERDGLHLSGTFEGAHVSVAKYTKWNRGRYRYSLARETNTTVGKDTTKTWMTATVTDLSSKSTDTVGSLCFATKVIKLSNTLGSFLELYGSIFDELPQHIQPLRVIVGNWLVNGKPIRPSQISVTYHTGVPSVAEVKTAKQFVADGECEKTADLPMGDDAVGFIIRSKPIKREPGHYILWTAPK